MKEKGEEKKEKRKKKREREKGKRKKAGVFFREFRIRESRFRKYIPAI